MNAKMAIVANWFGEANNLFQIWLDACGYNQAITWFLITDINISKYVIPSNVVVMNMTLPSLKQLIEERVGYEVRYQKAWDFCALKALLGVVFRNELRDFSFWGWCDLDMVFGDIMACVGNRVDFSDKILPKGHLSFVRNSSAVNEFILGHEMTRAATSISGAGLPCFDEEAFPKIILKQFGMRMDDTVPFVNTSCRAGSFRAFDTKALFDALGLVDGKHVPFVATWHQGAMMVHAVRGHGDLIHLPVCYFHFFRREMKVCIHRLEYDKHYLIVPNKIVEYDGHDLSEREIRWLDRPRIHWRYYLKRLNLKTALRKLGVSA